MLSIEFNKDLYSKKAILGAIDDYSEFAEFEIRENGNDFVVDIKNIKKDFEDTIKDEFCNYALGLMKK